jgi:hypothetical protein
MTSNPSLFRARARRAFILAGTLVLASAGRESMGDTVQLSVSNVMPSGNNYVTVALVQKPAGVVEITVTPNPSSLYKTTPHLGIAGFGFNTQLNLSASNIAFVPASSGLDWKLQKSQSCANFGTFTWVLSGSAARSLNPLVIDITYTSAVPADFEVNNPVGYQFAADVVGFTTATGPTSQWVANPPNAKPLYPLTPDLNWVWILLGVALLIAIVLVPIVYFREKPSPVSQ